jgi:hypothetical protein
MQHHAMRVVPSITTENLASVERIAMEWRWLEAILGVTSPQDPCDRVF